MLSKPQTRAISVALLDHGETVPGRGVTNSASGRGAARTAPAPRMLIKRWCSALDRGSETSAKYAVSAAKDVTAGTRARTEARSLSKRNAG
ncbi:MAG: hypothetical protein USCGTAYLOR_01372 [Chromatiales bacterium USCg_Taylor]|nr:MAG: hypothetical protein USCGTAYLOR_01372 [Chromatiales bacterium USCg_Taylor]